MFGNWEQAADQFKKFCRRVSFEVQFPARLILIFRVGYMHNTINMVRNENDIDSGNYETLSSTCLMNPFQWSATRLNHSPVSPLRFLNPNGPWWIFTGCVPVWPERNFGITKKQYERQVSIGDNDIGLMKMM